jgi:hypothetical protein
MEENKEIKVEEQKEISKDVKKDTNKKGIPMYVYVVGIVVVLLVILIIALVVMANGEEEVPVVDTPVVEENINDKDIKSLTLEDVKKIYNESLPYLSNYVGTTLYHTDKMTITNANTAFLRAFAFTKIEFNDDNVLVPVNEDGSEFCIENDCTPGALLNKGWYRFNANLLNEKSTYYYGASIVHGNFSEYPDYIVKYNNDIYQHEVVDFEYDGLSYHYREYDDYEIGEDTLYIMDKYLYITGKLDDRKTNYNVVIYGDSAKKVTVGTGTYVVADNLVDLIVPNYDRKKVSYKHAFKKAQDGHWYWISTEQVK